MNFQGAIFDMDGTIIDSMSIYRTLGSNFLKKYHITPPYDLHKKIESMTLESSAIYFAENFSLNMTPQEVLRQWHEDVAFEYENNVPLKEYTREFLQKLHKKNIKLCVATLTNQELAQKVLRRLGVLDLFQFIITAEEVGKDKNHPDIYLQAAEKMHLAVKDCVIFEDSFFAAVTGKKAGFPVCGIYDVSAKNYQEEMKEICSHYIYSFNELL